MPIRAGYADTDLLTALILDRGGNREAARSIGVSPGTVSDIVTGQKGMGETVSAKLESWFGRQTPRTTERLAAAKDVVRGGHAGRIDPTKTAGENRDALLTRTRPTDSADRKDWMETFGYGKKNRQVWEQEISRKQEENRMRRRMARQLEIDDADDWWEY